ncbi:MAG: ATP-grasp domain-containing protein [Burkholderiales bacterium]
MRIAVLTKRRTGLVEVLAAHARRDGHEIALIGLADLAVDDRLGGYDLVVQKSKQLFFLYAGLHAKALGVRVVPEPETSRQITNRIERPFLAQRADIAVPRFWFGTPEVVRDRLAAEHYPVVRKPIVGSGSTGVQLVDGPSRLPATTDRHLYLEECIPGRHLLVYFVGEDVRVFEKRPFVSGREPVHAIDPQDDVAANVTRWRRATGLPFGHLDLVRDDRSGELVLVDAGPFPQFPHWPEAAERVSDLVIGRVR